MLDPDCKQTSWCSDNEQDGDSKALKIFQNVPTANSHQTLTYVMQFPRPTRISQLDYNAVDCEL